MKTNSFFLNPSIAEIHTDFLRGALFSVICEDPRESVDNPSGRDGLGCLISLRRSRFRLQRFRFAIPPRRIRHKRIEQMLRGVSDFIDGSIERGFIRVRRFRESAKFPDKLQRRCVNFVIRRWRLKIMQGLDASAHDRPSAIVDAGSTISQCRRFSAQ